jgi:hypothetical protein
MASGFLEGSALALPKNFRRIKRCALQFFSLLYALVDFVSFGRSGSCPTANFGTAKSVPPDFSPNEFGAQGSSSSTTG